MKFKMYVPDKGLADIIVLNDYEFRTFIDHIARSDIMESNYEEKEKKQLFLEQLQEIKLRQPLLFYQNDDLFLILSQAYETNENLIVFIHKSAVDGSGETIYPYHQRYKKAMETQNNAKR